MNKSIRKGTVGSLTGIPTGFPTGQTIARYQGRVNGMHAFRSLTVNETAFITDEQLTQATWTPR